jgi:hypothetical protein
MKYEIWAEGFWVQGQDTPSGAYYYGSVEAPSFQEACDIRFVDEALYNRKTLSIWGCALFDNEKEARINFG